MNNLFEFYEEMEFSAPIELNQQQILENIINRFLDEMVNRADLLVSPRTREFFSLKEFKFTSMLPPKFIQKFYCKITNEDTYLAGFDLQYDMNILVMYLNCSGVISNFGRIWSILQKNYLGGFEIYYIDKKNSLLPQYRKIFGVKTEEKITCGRYVKQQKMNNFYFSYHSGKLLKYSFCEKFKTKKVSSKYLLKEPIIKLMFAGDSKMVVIGETSMRIFNTEHDEIRGGGSIKSRLESAYLLDACYCEDSKSLLMVSNEGDVLLYRLKDYKPEFVYHEVLDMKVLKMSYVNGNLFLMNSSQISVFRIKFYEDSVKFYNTANFSSKKLLNLKPILRHSFTDFYYDALNNFLYVGDDYGVLYTFDVKNGYLSSAILAHSYEIKMVGFIDSMNTIVTQSLEEMRFWRIGEISDKMGLEIMKVIEKDYYLNLSQNDEEIKIDAGNEDLGQNEEEDPLDVGNDVKKQEGEGREEEEKGNEDEPEGVTSEQPEPKAKKKQVKKVIYNMDSSDFSEEED